MSYCRYCGTEISYTKTANGKWLPYDVTGQPHFCQEEKMKVYAAYKNNEILHGKIFALPEQAFNFFVEEFLKEYPNAKINDIADELKKDLVEEGCFSVQADNDEWGCKTYISKSGKTEN